MTHTGWGGVLKSPHVQVVAREGKGGAESPQWGTVGEAPGLDLLLMGLWTKFEISLDLSLIFF